jgi:polysaccharide export outer membrane protein
MRSTVGLPGGGEGLWGRCRGLLALAWVVMLALSWGGARQAWAMDDAYTINPGDVLQVTVWKEDGLDRETLVLPDGTISFPLVGALQASGKTVSQLQQEIATRIDHFIHDATVTVTIKAALGNSVDVIGQVTKPGEIVLAHRSSVMQALSIAGGLTPYAGHGSIVVLRQENGKQISIPIPYDAISRGEKLDRNILLNPGDVIVVPTASLF